eukprot:TRINITY_DN64552_c0_g1_i1.p1 TRINITY_DN64552_c0_g1~~TRINITY_DN64552_c0_g1_i1.p1  ORF type:complete len:359 (+),score=86.57 TRINITY_DN64552_c0_g1_i1:80-1156(+)
MKKRPICAAAQDDLGGNSSDDQSDDEVRQPKKKVEKKKDKDEDVEQVEAVKETETVIPATETGAVDNTKKKKEKEFAWMDSDEEEEEEVEVVEGGERKREAADREAEKDQGSKPSRSRSRSQNSRSRSRSRKSRSGSKARRKDSIDQEDEDADVSEETLNDVHSFGRMMILAPALTKQMQKMTPENLAAACRAMGRTKFFDSDILKDLSDVVRGLLRKDKLSAEQTNDALQCLWDINAYDKQVLSAVASAFKAKLLILDPTHRQAWQEIFRGFKHEKDKDFVQLLETPPIMAVSPGFRAIRCFHHSKGFCAVGEKDCSYSHAPGAPLTLQGHFAPARTSPLVMTQNQYTLGQKYGRSF